MRERASHAPLTKASAARSDGYLARQGNNCESSETTDEIEWWRDLNWAWLRAQRTQIDRWRRRRRRFRRLAPKLSPAGAGDALRKALYAERRVRSLCTQRDDYLAQCWRMVAVVSCACGDKRIPTGCGRTWLCGRCRKRYYQRVAKRLIAATRAWSDAKADGWSWRLLRLSTAHSGDVQADRAELVRAWALLRQSVTKRVGKFPFAMTWEVTPGRDGKGHVHAHVIVLWPWVDYAWVRKRWVESAPNSNHIRIEGAKKGAKGAAIYAAKYASKGVNVQAFEGVLAGRVLAAQYGQRRVNTSRHFHAPPVCECRDCGCAQLLKQRPAGMAALAPSVEWDRWCRRFRSTMDPPQQKEVRFGKTQKATPASPRAGPPAP